MRNEEKIKKTQFNVIKRRKIFGNLICLNKKNYFIAQYYKILSHIYFYR